ncbi:MAG: D-alanine--poly(phosphoribitol) ligase subunit 1 [Flavobacteriales bacterium]|nr:D-alanine--poly(phosphoribitol) ligase subunit 1 [Flavobacteriales bacterium]NUQ16182.1 amino acid adenylation domain-containing protein [Flavobacteriales bacterium]
MATDRPRSAIHLALQALQQHPDRPALIADGRTLTAAQALARAARVAHNIQHQGGRPGHTVALCLDRSPELIISVLGIVQAGAAYVPIDPTYPAERIAGMLEDAKPPVVITSRAHQHLFQGTKAKVLLIEDIDLENGPLFEGPCPATPDDLLYVLFTSGSTGRPKGVAMHHAPLTNLIQWQLRTSVLKAGDRTLQFAPISFDVSFQEIFTTFAQGGTLVLITDEDRLNSTQLLRKIIAGKINRIIVPFVALQYLAEAVERTGEVPTTLKEVFTSGEQLKITPAIANLFAQLPGCRFCNQYGPTEGHVVSELELKGDPSTWPALPNIGSAIDNVKLYVLDEQMKPVKQGEEGELYLGGACVAKGYIGRDDLTAERFLADPFIPGGRLYKTGDRAAELPNGEIDYKGRIDGQVKVRGYRIELGEVEVAMEKHPAVEQAVANVREDRPGLKRLIGYYVAKSELSTNELRKHLASLLPDYMQPSAFVAVKELPRTPSGKIDRKALPAPDVKRPDLDVAYAAPSTAAQQTLANVWADLLGIDRVGIDDNFFDLGGNSLLSIQAVAQLEGHGLKLPIVKLYQHPTVRACAAFLEGDANAVSPAELAAKRKSIGSSKGDVAIIGMSGRFPGAESVEQLWKNLLDKKNSISTWTADEIDPSVPAELRNDPDYVKARGVITDADKFDHAFFGVNPKVAALMDPQQRVFLETAWAALEDAAYDPAQFAGLIGVFAGMGNNTYYTRNVIGHPELIEQVGDFAVMTANEKDYIATRLAFEFDLRGPALSIHTACSTSLVAIAQAFKALRDGECDMALAGGIAITAPINSGIVYNEGGMYSPDGSTRAFDANGKGTSFSDGCGIIVLKRLDDAVRDKDHIYAVVKGAALNNDGSEKASFTAPSVRGQAEVIAMAQADAGVSPEQISYVEAHGTATPLGDPIEVEALTLAFGGQQNGQHCALGSVKSNIGHLTAAAGAAGVIKTALALQQEKIPASIGFEKPNPAIDFANSPFRVAQDNIAWPRTNAPRIAGVSSFGVGGTNAHVILAEPPVATASSASRAKQLFLLSAKSKASLDTMTENLRAWLLLDSARSDSQGASLADAAYTLQVGRRSFKHRRLIVGGSHGEVIDAIANKDAQLIGTRELHEAAPGVVFMFPGQGSQYVNMGRDLCASEPVFKQHFDRCCDLFSKEFGTDLKAIIFSEAESASAKATADEQLKQTIYTQASLFTMHYSLAKLWMHWGITPDAMMGHSIGEFAAACLAGVFSLEDAVKLVANRGRMMQDLPGGSMLSVRAAEEDVLKKLPAGCSIAANNGPQLCVASGPHEAIATLQAELEKDGITCKLLVTSHAFHSPMMDAIVEPYRKVVESVKLNAPRIPIVSTVTAEWLKDDEATSPKYWSDHLRATVRFAQAVKFAWQDADPADAKAMAGSRVMLEVGPRTTATTLARQQSTDNKKQVAVPSLGDAAGNNNELTQLLKAVGGLWQSGIVIDWAKFYEKEERRRISMPTYAFERIRHWVDPVALVGVRGEKGESSEGGEKVAAAGADSNLSPKEQLIAQIKHLLEESSGLELAEASNEETFLEMGLDSLFLTQVATSLSKKFGVKISFRQLNEELPNLDKLADHILPHWNGGAAVARVDDHRPQQATPTTNALEDAPELKKAFGAQARISKEKVDDMTPQQRAWFDAFVKRYVAKTAKSKAFTQENRKPMADPRVVTGFKPQTKELIYQVVVDRSVGCHLWDIDGNEYVDILSGFGSSMFGYMPDFIKEACHKQLDTGIEIGPMHPLAAEVSKLLCELTGAERAAVCNTGSEAVLGAMRMARTVTGRSLIISFSGSYHGINDEVIIRGSKSKKSYPGAPGIMPEAVQNMLVLDYGTPESLEIIKQRCHEAAAILVEPVQSRRMEFRPVDFLRELRRITQEHGTALIFDEVITGFRTHPNGVQSLFGIQADIGTYGKVIGGGMPVGAMIGKSEWMDALDGGHWQYGDDSVPPAGVTYFAGTFVRHPLTLAAMKAALVYMKNEGPALQERLNTITEDMVERVNGLFDKYQLPYRWVNFGSAFKTKYDESVNYTELFFMLMRYHGVHVLDFPHFITTAHTAADIEFIIGAVEKTCQELRESGFMPERTYPLPYVNSVLGGLIRPIHERIQVAERPPVPGARLGRTPKGDAAWFLPDPQRQGKYLMIEEN